MRSVIAIVLLAALCFAEVPLLHTDNAAVIPGSYIVVFRSDVSDAQVEAHLAKLQDAVNVRTETSSEIVASFRIGTFRGFSAKLSAGLLENQRNSPLVEYIEADQIMRANEACVIQQTTEWGLDRISERQLDLDGQYIYEDVAGSGVDAYVVDTGIRTTHKEFSGRALWGANFADSTNRDCNGHGTHVAGTIGGTTYGVAKQANLYAVKVLDCAGSGTNTGVIQGVEWAVNKAASRKRPSVANMSLGGGKSTALETAVKQAIAAGLNFVLAAGNENVDACTTSPAGSGGSKGPAVTVGATTVSDEYTNQVDERAYFSNYGTCLDIFAPGQLITAAWNTSDTALKTISGTSMASPHVAGAVAMYLSQNNGATPAQIKTALATGATTNLIDLACTGTVCKTSPNRLLYIPCE
jgi:subtilisin family serine protease